MPGISLLVCVNRSFRSDRRCCAARGSEKLADRLEREIAARGIDAALERIVCLGQCAHGPSMRIAPGGEFFLSIDEAGLEAVLAALCRAVDDEAPPA